VNGVNGGDTVFSQCMSVCVCVCVGVCGCVCAQQTGESDSLKRLKLRTSDLFLVAHVGHEPLKIFSKKGHVQGHVTPKFLCINLAPKQLKLQT